MIHVAYQICGQKFVSTINHRIRNQQYRKGEESDIVPCLLPAPSCYKTKVLGPERLAHDQGRLLLQYRLTSLEKRKKFSPFFWYSENSPYFFVS